MSGTRLSFIISFTRSRYSYSRFAGKFVRDGVNERSLVGRGDAAGRVVFPRGLGLAGHFAYKVGAVDSFAARSLTLSGFPVYVARLPPAPFTEPIRAGLAFVGD